MNTNQHLAQFNVAKMKMANDIEDPLMSDFVSQINEVNAMADEAKGFVWRLKDVENDSTSFDPYNDKQMIVNLSVWEMIINIFLYVYLGRVDAIDK